MATGSPVPSLFFSFSQMRRTSASSSAMYWGHTLACVSVIELSLRDEYGNYNTIEHFI